MSSLLGFAWRITRLGSLFSKGSNDWAACSAKDPFTRARGCWVGVCVVIPQQLQLSHHLQFRWSCHCEHKEAWYPSTFCRNTAQKQRLSMRALKCTGKAIPKELDWYCNVSGDNYAVLCWNSLQVEARECRHVDERVRYSSCTRCEDCIRIDTGGHTAIHIHPY